MMHAHLLEMDAILSAPGFFDFLADLDCDRALDSRDAEPFDAQWMASFDEIDGDPGAALDRPAVDALREKAFKLAFGASGHAGVRVRRHRADREEPVVRPYRRLADERPLECL
ncbi:hypothetical protein AB3K92_00050 [Burkholderia sp. Bmkn7]|uniref:hypothetical protein n=1 Tax=unclassified Burkholderia TaxID=2613784 RepID=UPI000415E3A2|nr:hypothetical protein [Burkholderia sp. AU4i]